jgi:FtsH-binding integral membrane protein
MFKSPSPKPRRKRMVGLPVALIVVVGVLVGVFLWNPPLGTAFSAAGTLVALFLALNDRRP